STSAEPSSAPPHTTSATASHFPQDPLNPARAGGSLPPNSTTTTTAASALATSTCPGSSFHLDPPSHPSSTRWVRAAALHPAQHAAGSGLRGGRSGGVVYGGRRGWRSGEARGGSRSRASGGPSDDVKDCEAGGGPMSQRLVSCLLMGLPMVLHPVIFLRLLLHRLLSSMNHLPKWKSCASRSSWASQSEPWRARNSTYEIDSPTLRRRRKVNLTLDFADGKSDEGASTPTEQLKSKKVPKLESKNSKDKEEDKNGRSISQVFHRASKSRQNSFHSPVTSGPSKSSSSQKNDTPPAASERGWKFRETFTAFSTKDVSDTISHFLPSVLRSTDSHQSISTSSRSPTPPIISPPTQRRKSFRFKHSTTSKSAQENTSSDSTPNMGPTESANDLETSEQFINAFQKQIQNLPSYERIDSLPNHNLRPRSRSVPRVTYNSMATLGIPVTRSPSLTPEIARATEFSASHSAYLNSVQSSTHLSSLAPPTLAASTPLMSPGRSMKLPLRSTMQGSSSGGGSGSKIPGFPASPYLSPRASPRSVTSPRLLSPALSPITPPKHDDMISSASSTVTPNPYRRLDSPVYIVLDMPDVHRAVLACVE
ncbi:hypothetical protein FHG87_023712, partial [Trinorchestia longiramus]